ncbi:MAG: hypothetical protein ACI4JF_02805 [Oscillospiraceae bacterium]
MRSYNYGTIGADAAEAMAALTASDELKNQAAEAFYASNMANYDEINQYYKSNTNRNIKSNFNVSYPWDDYRLNLVIDDREFYVELNDAYRNDLKNLTAEQYLDPAKSPYCNVQSSYNVGMPGITSNYTETLSFLSANGLLPPRTSMEELLLSKSFDNTKIIILSPEDYKELSNGAVYSSCVNISFNYVDDKKMVTGRYILEYSDELAEIMENVTDKYISDEPCYTIVIDGTKYKVPEEYSETAAELYSMGSVSPYYDMSDDTYIYYHN